MLPAMLLAAAVGSGVTAPAAGAGTVVNHPVLWTATGSGTLVQAQSVDTSGNLIGTDAISGPAGEAQLVGDGIHGGDMMSSLLYFPTSGWVSPAGVLNNHIVTSHGAFSWGCAATDGCAATYRLVGYDDVDGNGTRDVIWYDKHDNLLQAWATDGTLNVVGKFTLQSGCPYLCPGVDVVAASDFNGDGHADVLTYDPFSGVLAAALLNGYGAFIGQQVLDWQCAQGTGCATDWKIVGVGDYNGDGITDVLWNDPWTGQVAAWLLNGHGTVVGTATLNTNTAPWTHIIGTSTGQNVV
jgi:hypothetical protein